MPKAISVEQLKAMTWEARDQLYVNALRQGTPEAKLIIGMLLQHQLLDRPGGGLPRHHPIIRTMEEVIRSSDGRAGALGASEHGLPALAGVDAQLQQALGHDYGARDTTSWAGTLVAEVMDEAGYKQVGKKSLPPSCVAKTAALFKKG